MGLNTKQWSQSLSAWLERSRPRKRQIPLCDYERIQYEVRPCDVILVEGTSRVSEMVKAVTQSPWSHAALYIGRFHDIDNPMLREEVSKYFKGPPETQLIVESLLEKGTVVSPLSDYRDDHVRICRPNGVSRQDAQKVVGFTIGRLGLDYDIRQIFDLMRFLIPYNFLSRRWRSSLFKFHAGMPTQQICSTLIAEAFASVNFPILPVLSSHATRGVELVQRNPRLYTPSDFDYSPYFEIIKYPIFELTGTKSYRDLPWAHPGTFSHDEGVIVRAEDKPREVLQSSDGQSMEADKSEGDNSERNSEEIHKKTGES